MSRVLHIPTGLVFFVPDLTYFDELFTADPKLFNNRNCVASVLCMSRIIDLIDEVDKKEVFFNSATYVESVVEFQQWGRETFEILD